MQLEEGGTPCKAFALQLSERRLLHDSGSRLLDCLCGLASSSLRASEPGTYPGRWGAESISAVSVVDVFSCSALGRFDRDSPAMPQRLLEYLAAYAI